MLTQLDSSRRLSLIADQKQAVNVGHRLLSIQDAVNYLGGSIKASTLRAWVWRKQISYVRLGGAIRISAEVLDQLVEQGTVKALDN